MRAGFLKPRQHFKMRTLAPISFCSSSMYLRFYHSISWLPLTSQAYSVDSMSRSRLVFSRREDLRDWRAGRIVLPPSNSDLFLTSDKRPKSPSSIRCRLDTQYTYLVPLPSLNIMVNLEWRPNCCIDDRYAENHAVHRLLSSRGAYL